MTRFLQSAILVATLLLIRRRTKIKTFNSEPGDAHRGWWCAVVGRRMKNVVLRQHHGGRE